ncbi:24329_t:CDS:1, partial [Dentiscutata erythropus]
NVSHWSAKNQLSEIFCNNSENCILRFVIEIDIYMTRKDLCFLALTPQNKIAK